MLIFSTYILLKGLFMMLNVHLDTTNASEIQGKLPNLSLITTLLNMFFKPNVRTWDSETTSRAAEKVGSTVEMVVRQKVKKLRPFLQDDDLNGQETLDEIKFEGNDETTIIEFVPQVGEELKVGLRNHNDTFKATMRRYKKVRNKIYDALEEELVSDNTKNLVIQTLDELLSKMIETQCHWNGEIESKADNTKSYDNRIIVPRKILNMWREEYEKLKTLFDSENPTIHNDSLNNLISCLTRLNSIINDVSVNLETLAKKYKIRCNVSKRDTMNKYKSLNPKHESLRLLYETDNERSICRNFKVCSKELTTFLMDFYNSVNDSTINVLKSYAEMFTRDVNTDVSDEKHSIIDLIFAIADQTEIDVLKIFINYTTHFHLDKHKSKQANIKFLSDYIKNVIQDVKEAASRNIYIRLNHLHNKVSSGIRQDVKSNLGVDLGNLERDATDKICLTFNICNGNVKRRRYGDDIEVENSVDNENKINIRIELTISNERNDLSKNTSKALESKLNTKVASDAFVRSQNVKLAKRTLNYENYANVTVTRTTRIMQTT